MSAGPDLKDGFKGTYFLVIRCLGVFGCCSNTVKINLKHFDLWFRKCMIKNINFKK